MNAPIKATLAVCALVIFFAMSAWAVSQPWHAEDDALPKGSSAQQADLVAQTAIPFVTKHCVTCHGGKKPKADLHLEKYTDEKSVTKDRKTWEQVLKMVESGEMPPPSKTQPTTDEREAFTKSLVALFVRIDTERRDPGRVVMRRLNKAEYANTIRDLLFVNFNPNDDFPNDDVAGGFDNNGAVLSLSQLLMERYLDAAENIVRQAFPPEGNWPAPRRLLSLNANVIQPPPEKGEQRDPRMLRPGKKLFTNVKVDKEGEYVFRVYGWHIEGDWGTPKIDMEVDDKVIKTFVSIGPGIGLTSFQYCRADLKPGSHKLAVSWPVDYLEPARREAFIKAAKDKEDKDAKDKAHKDAKDKDGKDAGKDFEPTNQAKDTPPKEQAKDVPAKDKQAKDGDKKPDPTPDFEPGYHMRWFEFAGPGTRTVAQKAIMTFEPGQAPKDAAREIMTKFISRAFRRPAQTAEVDRFLKLTDAALARGDSLENAVSLGIQAVLVSPKFLFRVELDDRPDSKDPHPIDDYQLAARLSYFLWSSMPDTTLTDLAAKKELHKNLPAQVERMLKDKKVDALADNFAAQWLHLRLLQGMAPDNKVFPDFDEPLRQAMLKESLLFFDSIVREDRSILTLINADYTFLNERLAKHYGIADTKGNRVGQKVVEDKGSPIKGAKFVRVQLQDGERGGILTQASILTVTSNPTRTNIVKRGKWVLEQILNAPPPPPPPNVPELPVDEKAIITGSLRQRMEKHRADPACANCHARMDPLGFAFENYDGIGKFRTKDGEFDVDASGVLPSGQTFQGAAELKTVLMKQTDKVAKGFSEKLLTFALGRGLEYSDRPAIDKIVRALGANEYRFSTLVVEIVQSDPFRLRRGKDLKDE